MRAVDATDDQLRSRINALRAAYRTPHRTGKEAMRRELAELVAVQKERRSRGASLTAKHGLRLAKRSGKINPAQQDSAGGCFRT
jgi:hypothetical protein